MAASTDDLQDRNRNLAEEALQDALLSVWRNAGSYSANKGAPMTWLVSICRYRALDLLRRERRELSLEPLLEQAAEGGAALREFATDGVDAALFTKAEARTLDECLGRLNEGQRNSLRLAYFDGCTHEEIARSLQAP